MNEEKVEILEEEIEIEPEQEESEAYVRYEITSFPSDFTLEVLNNRYTSGEIVIPPFQRKFVWSQDRASLLIDSFLMGLPVPSVFFYVDEENKSVVIDGQQRLKSIFYFFEGYFGEPDIKGKRKVFNLTGLSDKNPFSRKTYSDIIDTDDGRKLRSSVLRAMNIMQKAPKDGRDTAIYHIFERLNKGMVPLQPQEIRNCIYRGTFNKLLNELNESPNWRKVMGKEKLDSRQKDVELTLRVIALYKEGDNYQAPMKEFLNSFMSRHRYPGQDWLDDVKEKFIGASTLIVNEISDEPFRPRHRLNSSMLDSVFSIIMKDLDNLPTDIQQRYRNIPDNIWLSFGTNKTEVVKSRLSEVRKVLIG